MPNDFIAYYRVSTTRQGVSGLGLEAQRSAAESYALQSTASILREYTEVESGKRISRPQLQAAIAECRLTGATLLIAKLDRLARNVHFISGLLEANVNFIAADMPNADRFMLHIYAAMAEEEGRRISERTKSALASAKRRGTLLGEAAKTPEQRNSTKADEFSRQLGPVIECLHYSQGLSFRMISEELNKRGVPSFRGGVWHANTAYRLFRRHQRSLEQPFTQRIPK